MSTENIKTDLSASGATPSSVVHRPYAKWRAAALVSVHVLMTIHVLHWYVSGKTLAPLELNEVMYTFELGIVTAGFIFMCVAVLGTAFFGRFFCSWGCHILALQDFSSWLLGKVGIKPKAIRSRLLVWVPVVVAFYMFVWPQVVRLWIGAPAPILHLTTDEQGWASFTTENFWRNLPTPPVIIATFLICGFVTVYIFGSRAFCRYACPYGAVFALAERIAPGRIRVGDDCVQCGSCTAACTSHIRVHEELARFGTVVNPACMKDLDCIAVCPQQSLHYGFGLPSLAQRATGETVIRKRYDFSGWEEATMAVIFIALLLILRGLYDVIPFLLSLALAGIGAYGSVIGLRLVTQSTVRLNRWPLKVAGRWLPVGRLCAGGLLVIAFLVVHSGVIHYNSYQGHRLYRMTANGQADVRTAAAPAIDYLERAVGWGLVQTVKDTSVLAYLHAARANWPQARRHLRWLLEQDPGNAASHLRMGRVLASDGDRSAAHHHFETAVRLDPDRPESHFSLSGTYFEGGNPTKAMHHLREAIRLRPDYVHALVELGSLLLITGRSSDRVEGIRLFRRAIAIDDNFADAHYNLAVALAMIGKLQEAKVKIEAARKLNPDDETTLAFQQYLNTLRLDVKP